MKKLFTTVSHRYILNTLITGILLLNIFNANAQNNWENHYPLPGKQLFDVAYGAGKYIAVGSASIIRTSTDGVEWTTQPTNLSEYGALSSIIYVNGSFIAVGTGGIIVTSVDGVSWTQQNSGTTRNINGIAILVIVSAPRCDFLFKVFFIIGSYLIPNTPSIFSSASLECIRSPFSSECLAAIAPLFRIVTS